MRTSYQRIPILPSGVHRVVEQDRGRVVVELAVRHPEHEPVAEHVELLRAASLRSAVAVAVDALRPDERRNRQRHVRRAVVPEGRVGRVRPVDGVAVRSTAPVFEYTAKSVLTIWTYWVPPTVADPARHDQPAAHAGQRIGVAWPAARRARSNRAAAQRLEPPLVPVLAARTRPTPTCFVAAPLPELPADASTLPARTTASEATTTALRRRVSTAAMDGRRFRILHPRVGYLTGATFQEFARRKPLRQFHGHSNRHSVS